MRPGTGAMMVLLATDYRAADVAGAKAERRRADEAEAAGAHVTIEKSAAPRAPERVVAERVPFSPWRTSLTNTRR